jgi:hypothetical protein
VDTWESFFAVKSRRRRHKWRQRAMKTGVLALLFGSSATALFFLIEGLPRQSDTSVKGAATFHSQ